MRSLLPALILALVAALGCNREEGGASRPPAGSAQKGAAADAGTAKGDAPKVEPTEKDGEPAKGKEAESPKGKRGKVDLTPLEFQAKPAGAHFESLTVPEGASLAWVVSVPKGYDRKTPVPLVVALHDAGKDAKWYGNALVEGLVGPGLAKFGAVIIAPDIVEGQDWATETNDSYVEFLTRSVMKTYAIDPKKVVLTGYSAGGVGTWYMAGRHADLYTAAIPIAGKPVGSLDNWKTPVYAIHSDADKTFPIGPVKEAIEKINAKSPKSKLKELHGLGHFDMPKYVEPLGEAVAWLEELWK